MRQWTRPASTNHSQSPPTAPWDRLAPASTPDTPGGDPSITGHQEFVRWRAEERRRLAQPYGTMSADRGLLVLWVALVVGISALMKWLFG